MLSQKILSALAASAALATVPVAASAQEVAPVNVESRAPTEVRIAIAGKPALEVRREVGEAAGVVCRNAQLNRELAFYDYGWCRDATQRRAMSHYATIVRHQGAQFAARELILAVR